MGTCFAKGTSTKYVDNDNAQQTTSHIKKLPSAHKGPVSCISRQTPSDETVLTGGDDCVSSDNFIEKTYLKKTQSVRYINWRTSAILNSWEKLHEADITCILYLNDLVLSSSRDVSILACPLFSKNEVKPIAFTGHNRAITVMEALGTSNKFVSGSRDTSIRVWDISKQVQIGQVNIDRNVVTDIKCFGSNADTNFLQTSEDLQLRMWDVRSLLQPTMNFSAGSNIQVCAT